MPLATTTRFVNNREIDTAFEVAGSGAAMVLGHSSLCSRLMDIEAVTYLLWSNPRRDCRYAGVSRPARQRALRT